MHAFFVSPMAGCICVESLLLFVCFFTSFLKKRSGGPEEPASSGTVGMKGKAVFEFALLMVIVCIPWLGSYRFGEIKTHSSILLVLRTMRTCLFLPQESRKAEDGRPGGGNLGGYNPMLAQILAGPFQQGWLFWVCLLLPN